MKNKTFTCDIKEIIASLDSDDGHSIFIGKISWNGRNVRGLDLRELDDDGNPRKGITIPFSIIDDLTNVLVRNGYGGTRERLEESISDYESRIYSKDHFHNMFKDVDHEVKNYTRDKYGYLMNSRGSYVIEKSKR